MAAMPRGDHFRIPWTYPPAQRVARKIAYLPGPVQSSAEEYAYTLKHPMLMRFLRRRPSHENMRSYAEVMSWKRQAESLVVRFRSED